MPAVFGSRMEQQSFSDGTTSSVRKLTEDLLKTRINEEMEEEEPFHGYGFGRSLSYDRKSSIGGVSSNESLWGDARRLSEAGVRRTSDNSVILTEDTDSFIVGDKVWVGGTKPGRIAFIGETSFAAGDWAGIVLEEPIGKNDGSVGGTRYFQCEPKKGIFSRLGRLSRYQLAVPSPPMAPSPSPPPSLASSIIRRTTPPPVPRTPPLVSPPSPAPSTRGDPVIGDRVIVMSGQGSKIGILRFKGETEFANGIWCGVELDDPIGKNDGSVGGIRYFECQPKYGLFAPATKVSRSPAPDRRPSCQIHHTVKRASSKESLTSVTSRASTIASTASRKPLPRASTAGMGTPKATPQELLKTKQDQIEKLLKERNLDRTRMVRAAEQTEEAEKQLNHLKEEFELFKAESQKKTLELQEEIKKVQQEKSDLVAQLEDWKFRAEEEAIFKSTLEEEQEEQQQCMDAWKKAFSEKEEEVKKLLLQVSELKEAKEQIEFLHNEMEIMKKKATENENELKKELIDTIDRANRMEQNYNDIHNEFENHSLKDEIVPLKEMIAKLEASLSESENKRIELEKASMKGQETIQKEANKSQGINDQLVSLEAKLKEAQQNNSLLTEENKEFQNKCTELSNLLTEAKKHEEEFLVTQKNYKELIEQNVLLKKNLEELEANKVSMLEEQNVLRNSVDEWKKTLSQKEEEIKALFLQVDELTETKQLMSSLKEETEAFRNKTSEIENELKKELIETIERANKMEENLHEAEEQNQLKEKERLAELASLKETIAQLEASLSETEKSKNKSETVSNELSLKLKDQDKTIEDLQKQVHDLEYKVKEAETYNKLLGEGEQKLKSQCAEMSNLLTQVTQLKEDLSEAQNKYKNALDQNNLLVKELNEIQASSNNKLIEIDRKYSNDIQNLKKKLEEFSSELTTKEKELNEEKIKADEHEKEFSSLQKELVDLKHSLEANQNSLNDKETEICLLKKDLVETKEQLNKSIENLELLKTDFSSRIADFEKELICKNTAISELMNEKNNLMASNENEKSGLLDKVALLESSISSLDSEKKSYLEEIDKKCKDISSLELKCQNLDNLYRKQMVDLESKTSEFAHLETEMKDFVNKCQELETIQKRLEETLDEKVRLIDDLKYAEKEFQVQKDALTNDVNFIKIDKSKLEEEIVMKEKELEKLKESYCRKEEEIEALNAKLLAQEKQTDNEIAILKNNVSKLEISLTESEQKIQTLEESLSTSKEKIKEQESMLQESKKELRDMEYKLQEAETCNKLLGEEEQELKKKCDELSNLMTQVSQLQEELQIQETNCKRISDNNENLLKEINELTNQKAEIISEKERIEESLASWKQTASDKSEELKAANDLVATLTAHVTSSKEEAALAIEKLQKELEAAKTRISELKGNSDCLLDEKNKAKEEAEREINFLKDRVAELEGAVSEYNSLRTDLENKLDDKDTELKQLKTTIESQENSISDFEIKLKSKEEEFNVINSQLEENISNLRSEAGLLSVQITSLKEELTSSKNEVEILYKEKDSMMHQIKSLELENTSAKEEESKLRITLKETEDRLSEKETGYEALSVELGEQIEAVSRLSALVKELEAFKGRATEAERELQGEVASLNASIASLNTALAQSEQSREALGVDLTEAVSKVQNLEREVSELKETNDDLQNKLMSNANLHGEVEELLKKKSHEIQELSKTVSSLNEKLMEKENEIKINGEENVNLKKQISELKSSADNKIADLNKKYDDDIENMSIKIKEYAIILDKKNNELSEEKIKQDEMEKEFSCIKTSLECNMNEREREISILKDEVVETKNLLENSRKMTEELKTVHSKNEELLKKKAEEISELLNTVSSLNEKLSLKENELKDTSQVILDLKNQISNSQSSSDNRIADLDKKYNEDIGNMKAKIQEYANLLEKKNNELTDEKIKLDEKEKEFNSFKANFETNMHDREKEIIILKNELDEKKNLLENARKAAEDFKGIHSEKYDLLNKDLEAAQNKIKDLESETKNLVHSKDKEIQHLNTNISSLENKVAALLIETEKHKNDASLKEHELALLRVKYNELEECIGKQSLELQSKTLKADELENELKALKSSKLSSDASKLPSEVSEGSEMAAWLEEKELAASEINFLNSIIVDMQKKIDALNQRIQILESGETSTEMNGVKKKKKEVTPRMFCDICDVFDAHETEDCPKQASTDSPPPVHHHPPMGRGMERPYCDICEVFGHSTEECDDTETF